MNARLSVNVDHVATLREARHAPYPRPLEAARLAEDAGAHGITVHLRGDRRHIQDADVLDLAASVRGKLNLEMALTEEMISFALEVAPHQVTLVPERPEEVTTEGGLDVEARSGEIDAAAARLSSAGIAVSLFIDPVASQIRHLADHLGSGIAGFELNTDAYARSGADRGELGRLAECARLGRETGFAVYAGHGLTTDNVASLAGIGTIEEFNIGHWIVSRAVIVGMRAAVAEMLAALEPPPIQSAD